MTLFQGMGIDINDIEIVMHFAPTGNVCDYVQEIGRAARRHDLNGEAIYNYQKRDFKHINRLHGMSGIKHYQIINIIEKINDLYKSNQEKNIDSYTKRRNALLIDAENFSYIFKSPVSDEDNNINKVKTALLLIQKDFESRIGFSPITVRPIPMFSIGFFKIEPITQNILRRDFPGTIEEIDKKNHIYKVFLKNIWNQYSEEISFPKFKYMLYSREVNFDFNKKYTMIPSTIIDIKFEDDYISKFEDIWESFKSYIYNKVQSSEYIKVSDIADAIVKKCKLNKYKAIEICEVIISSMDIYRKNFTRTTTPIVKENTSISGKTIYQFNTAVNSYFKWIEDGLNKIESEVKNGKIYVSGNYDKKSKEISTVLGVLESIGILTFEMMGGADSQIYIYINQIQALKNILNAPYKYKNRLLDMISQRHLISSKMLTYIYESEFSSDEIWDVLEDYFLGIIPEDVKKECLEENKKINFDN